MEELVNSQNFYLGCRVCRVLKNANISLSSQIPTMDISYSDAFFECTSLEVDQNDGLPERLCSDCAAKLTISYQFRKDAVISFKVLKGYSDMEKSENEIYERDAKLGDDMYDYETIEDGYDDQSSHTFEDMDEAPGDDAVAFLTGILKHGAEDDKKKTVEVRKVIFSKSQNRISTGSMDDPNRRHNCNVCHKKFQKRSNLIDHLRLHANVKVYACEFCEKSFVQAGNYKAHLRVHSKEKPYSCNYCNKSYSQSSSLKIHIRSHTQEKNYICKICDKGFTNASDLGKHRLIHDPVKKYRCEECGDQRQFTQKIHWRKHMEKHHPDVEFDYASKSVDATIKVEEEIEDGSKVIVEEYEFHEMD